MAIEMHMHQLIANQKQNKYNVPTMNEYAKWKLGLTSKKNQMRWSHNLNILPNKWND